MTTPTEPSRSGDGADGAREEPAVIAASSTAQEAPRGVTGFLSDLIGKIVRGIKGIPIVFAVSCQGVPPPPPEPEPAPETAAASVAVSKEPSQAPEPGLRPLGKFNITFYYVVGEEEIVARPSRRKLAANDNRGAAKGHGSAGAADAAGSGGSGGGGSGGAGGSGGSGGPGGSGTDLAAATSPEKVTIYNHGPKCEPIAETTREFAYELQMQGTGKLRDGRVVNVWGPCSCPRSPCFRVTPQQWGTSGTGRPLQPFRTVAVDPKVIKLGSLLHVPILEGRTMPGRAPWGGFVHDGCVVADDTGGAIRDRQIDLFVGRRGWFLGLSTHPGSHSWARQVPVYDGSKICERQGRKVARKSGAI